MSDTLSITRRPNPTKKQVAIGSATLIALCLITGAAMLAIGLRDIDRALDNIK